MMKAKDEEYAFIRWIIRVFCPGYSLHKKPTRKEREVVASEKYPVHEE